ncbi:MAG: transcriptional regulator [Vicinamibacterales bacterium]
MHRESPSVVYRFERFTLSPRRRMLWRDGEEVPLIPRYFDLLVLLIERRHEAVHRREIFERVWQDVAVSESALSQAVRTLRRTLGDDSREPRFIRTVSRHGYQFVLPGVVVEAAEPDGETAGVTAAAAPVPVPGAPRSAVPLWQDAAIGGVAAGVVAGALGGALLVVGPGSQAPVVIAPVLAVLGAVCGGLGAAGVAVGISAIGARLGWPAPAAWAFGGAIGGATVGLTTQWLARWAGAALFGLQVPFEGGLQGAVLGAAAGLGLAAGGATAGRRLALVATTCGLSGLLLTAFGHPLVGGTIHQLAQAVAGSPATLAPLGRLLGEPEFGAVSGAILAVGESATFGLGLAWGLRRHSNLT